MVTLILRIVFRYVSCCCCCCSISYVCDGFDSNRTSPLKTIILAASVVIWSFFACSKWIAWWISLCFVKQILSFAVQLVNEEWKKIYQKLMQTTTTALIEFQRVYRSSLRSTVDMRIFCVSCYQRNHNAIGFSRFVRTLLMAVAVVVVPLLCSFLCVCGM